MDTTPAGRLRDGTHDKNGRPHHKEDPQKYKGDNAGSHEYRNDSHRDYLHLPVQSTPICFRVAPLSSSHQGPLASSGGVKVLFIGALQTPNQPQSCPSRAAHQAGLTKLRATTIGPI